MTELEKVINNQRDNIDFGKLIEEAKASLDAYADLIERSSEKELDDMPNGATMLPALNTIFVLNAILNHIGLPDSFVPLIAAGVGIIEQSLTATISSKEGKEIYRKSKSVLEHMLTQVTIKTPKK